MLNRVQFCGILLLILPWLVIPGLQLLPSGFAAFSELARFVPSYWLLPPALLSLLLLWRAPWWLCGLASLALVLIVFMAMGFKWAWSAPDRTEGPSLKVVTFNTKSDKVQYFQGELTALESEIRAYDADLMALQDADGLLSGAPPNEPRKMGSFLNYPEAVTMGQYVLASRFPILACHAIDLDGD